ncbi:MAG: hypothetical protein DELT_00341 [Desulfovibrio sp.]
MPGNGPKRKRSRKLPPPLPAPRVSSCLYVRIAPQDVAMFRFLLEAEDNLAYMSTVDRWKSVLRVTFSPHQERSAREYLRSMAERVSFEIIAVQPEN